MLLGPRGTAHSSVIISGLFLSFSSESFQMFQKKKKNSSRSEPYIQPGEEEKKTSGLDVSPQCLWDFSHFSEMSKIPLSHQTNPAKGVLLQP